MHVHSVLGKSCHKEDNMDNYKSKENMILKKHQGGSEEWESKSCCCSCEDSLRRWYWGTQSGMSRNQKGEMEAKRHDCRREDLKWFA